MKRNIFYLTLLMLLGFSTQAQVAGATQKPNAADEAFNKGMMYSFSGLVLKDLEKAKGFFKQALELGNNKANLELGKIYAKENNTSSRANAVFYLENAAKLGNANAYTELGNLFYKIDLQYQDFIKAFVHFKKGADLGNNDCLAVTGYFYYKGLHKQQDYTKAFEYFTKAAKKDNPMALYFLGVQYRNGYGVERNTNLARELLIKSAGFNHFQAIHELKTTEPENPTNPIVPPAIIQLDKINGYNRIKHNMNAASVAGEYIGYAVRYDFSGKNILSVYPLEVNFNVIGDKVTGIWKEGGDTANINATYTESGLVFSNTEYNKTDHYSEFRGGEIWQFNNAKFNLLQQTDNTYITGNLQLYSKLRKEPGRPLYIHLIRATTKMESSALGKDAITLTSNNPFTNSIQATFKITQTTPVALKLFTAQGSQIFTQNAGTLLSGTYSHTFNIGHSLAAGSYVLQVETKAGNKSIIIVKQ